MQKTIGLILALFVCSLLLATSDAKKQKKEVYSTSRSYITQLSRQNFDKVVTKNRDKSVSIVHYYKLNDDGLDLLAQDLDQTATEMKGVFRFGAVNCDEDTEICNKEKITKTPTVRIYPPHPVPPLDHEGELSAKAIIQAAGKFVPSKVKEINSTTHSRFVDDNPSVPKVFLFTEKKGIPLIYRALSIAFDEKLFLSIVRSSEADLIKKYKVKTFPSILVVQTGEPKPIPYTGEIKYQPIFDFLNVYSQTFVPGGKDMNTNKPWLNEPVPELNLKSAGDTVLKTDGKLSVIYLDKQAPEEEVKNELSLLAADGRFENFKYSWLNIDLEPNWAKLFAKAQEYPKIVVASFGKRKKYLVHEGELTSASISKTLEKITNGDAHFTTVKGDLPSLTH